MRIMAWIGVFFVGGIAAAACRAEGPGEKVGEAASEHKLPPGFDKDKPEDLWAKCKVTKPEGATIKFGNLPEVDIPKMPNECVCGQTKPKGNGAEITLDPRNCGDQDICSTLAHEAVHIAHVKAIAAACAAKFNQAADREKCEFCTGKAYEVQTEGEAYCKQTDYEKDNVPDGTWTDAPNKRVCKDGVASAANCALHCYMIPRFKDGIVPDKGLPLECRGGNFVAKPDHKFPDVKDQCKCGKLAWDKNSECGGGVCPEGETCQSPDSKACGCKKPGLCNASDEAPTSACCGDGICQVADSETCGTCAADCGACPECGNGLCADEETEVNCPSDCQDPSCGDGFCWDGEDCETCAFDCGTCENGGSGGGSTGAGGIGGANTAGMGGVNTAGMGGGTFTGAGGIGGVNTAGMGGGTSTGAGGIGGANTAGMGGGTSTGAGGIGGANTAGGGMGVGAFGGIGGSTSSWTTTQTAN